MKLSEFDYYLPKNLIAQKPIRPRDHSRLMVLDRKKQTIKHDYFYNLGKYLHSGDILVANNSKVIPARLIGQKETSGKAEILLLRQISADTWQALIKNCKIGNKIIFSHSQVEGCTLLANKVQPLEAKIIKKTAQGTWQVKFNLKNKKLIKAINRLGQAPTPPYIKRLSNLKEYQTIYAQNAGSVAAPTAGFHFTKKLINQLKKQGIKFEFITLHVGLGTFQPVRTEDITKHQMHKEWAELKPKIAKRLNQAKEQGQRIIAIGTTSARTLETFVRQKKIKAGAKWTDLFIYPHDKNFGVEINPSYRFSTHNKSASDRKFFIDGLITNFHLPKSTLLMLVSAFAGQHFILHAYQEAISHKYRFYSFGDAMLII